VLQFRDVFFLAVGVVGVSHPPTPVGYLRREEVRGKMGGMHPLLRPNWSQSVSEDMKGNAG
jgi:hypothetical protein